MPPCASLPGRRGPVTNPWPAVGRPGPPGAKLQAAAHGIAKRRQRSAARGAQEVAHLHSTLEAGEPGPRGPWGGKGDARHGPVEGTPAGGIVSRSRVNATSTDSNADSEPMMGRTGCLNWARPDLREARGVIPGPTRPHLLSVPPLLRSVPHLLSPTCPHVSKLYSRSGTAGKGD